MKRTDDLDLEEIYDEEEEEAFDEEDNYEADSDYDDYDDEPADEEGAINYKMLLPILAVLVLIVIVIVAILVFKGNQNKDAVREALNQETEEEQTLTAQQPGEGEAETESSGNAQADDGLSGETAASSEESGAGQESVQGSEEPENVETQDTEDPQTDTMSTEQGAQVDVNALLSSGSVAETAEVTMGIDVAKYQGTIDWSQVAASGIDFAMVRVGYRASASREICEDVNARYNMQEAQKNGIKVGAYFFSTAVSAEEAVAEADWVADYISQYQITYPVAFDCEGFDREGSVQYHLTNAQRTDIALAFLQQIYNRGYTPMFYAAAGELSNNAKWDTTRIESVCKIWVSQYPSAPYPQTANSSYAGTHAMWQYTNQGTVAGINKPVDINVAYFGYEKAADAQNSEAPEEAHADVEALMNFTQVSETVTAKDSTNLRNIPSQESNSTIVYTLKNGETVTRTGISDSGWSRVDYNGQTLYAVSSYLTTDLNYTPPAEEQEGAGSGDGIKTKFTDRNEQVTAKIEVNLRALPSVTNPDATVVAVLHNGEYVTRTGINEEYGWSRVDYNGQTLYCISSYLTQ